MPYPSKTAPRWYTASDGLAADMSVCDQSTLQQHVTTCLLRHSTLRGLGMGVAAMQGLVATRFATVGVVVGVVIAALLWL